MKINKYIISLISLVIISGCTPGYRNIYSAAALGKLMGPRFIAHGANSVDVASTFEAIDERRVSNNWTTEWVKLAKEYEAIGENSLENNNLENAKYQLLKASVYYRIAAYPYPDSEEKIAAYKKCVTLFKESIKLLGNPPEIIKITFETKEIIGYFRKPVADERVPLVIILPGIDSTKEEVFWIEDHFLNRGMATFAFDLPGTGQSAWSMRPDVDRVFKRVLDYFEDESSILPDKIVIVGFNFGGYWGLKTLAKNPEKIRGVAAVSAPLVNSFNRNRINQMPRFLVDIFMKIVGEKDYHDTYAILESFSLEKQQLLQNIKGNVLIIGAGKDFFVPIEDIYLFPENNKKPTLIKIYKEEKFGIINDLQSDLYPLIADWVEELVQ